MANEITSLVYPPYLRDFDAYTHRKVFINIVESKPFSERVDDALDTALEKSKAIGASIKSVFGGDIDETAKNMAANEDNSGTTILSIVLPLPNELIDTQQHDWNTEKGILGTMLGGIENQSISEMIPGGSIAAEIAGKTPIIGAGFRAGAGMEVKQVLGAMSDAAGMRKPLSDPGYFQNYTGSQPRTFNMTFDFVPNNPNEAREIIAIIMAFKEFSSPSTMGVALLAPHYFDIDFSNDYISNMASMKGVVLQNIVVNYGADGSMQQFPDGTPKYIQMGLTFVERKMRTANYYRKK
jgi:hypothetical protein